MKQAKKFLAFFFSPQKILFSRRSSSSVDHCSFYRNALVFWLLTLLSMWGSRKFFVRRPAQNISSFFFCWKIYFLLLLSKDWFRWAPCLNAAGCTLPNQTNHLLVIFLLWAPMLCCLLLVAQQSWVSHKYQWVIALFYCMWYIHTVLFSASSLPCLVHGFMRVWRQLLQMTFCGSKLLLWLGTMS